MSHIDKLAILGIRSFSHEEAQYIKFFSPFTLIVGSNGTGKTTIIECLKYACTGDLPPNSKGGAFIHDTKIAGQTEVKAQVKLKFVDIDGQRNLCSRSMSLSQKKATAQQRSLDSSLQRYNTTTGETYSISSRCSDMDALIPAYLGVPKAILDNVIFCHQEESNWPLAESAILKKKFDEIFSSTKYTKALDSIKEIKKERNQEIRVDHARLDSLKADTTKSRRLKTEVKELKKRSEHKKQQIENADQKIHDIANQMDQLLEVCHHYEEILNNIKQIEHQKQMYHDQINELQGSILEHQHHESDNELEQLLAIQSSKAIANEETRQRLINEKDQFEHQLGQLRNSVSSKLTEMGRLQASAENHQQNIQDRDQLIEKLCLEFNIPISSHDNAFVAIQQVLKKNEDETKKIKEQAYKEQSSLSDQLQLLKSEIAGLMEAKKHTQRELEKEKDTLQRLNSQLDSFRVTQADVDMEKDRLTKEEDRLATHQAEMDSTNVDNQLASKEKLLREVDDKISNLNDEMSKLSRQGDTRAKLALKRTDFEAKMAAAKSIFEKCKAEVIQQLGTEPTLDRLDIDLKSILEKQTSHVSTLQLQYDQVNKDLSAVEALLSHSQKNIMNKRMEIKKLQQHIQKVCPDNPSPDEIKQLENLLIDIRNKFSSLGAAELLYQRFAQKAGRNHQCPLCVRPFSDDTDFDQFLQKMQSTIEKIPNQRSDYSKKIEALEEKLQKLRSLEGSWQQLETLEKKDITQLEKAASEQEQKQKDAIENLHKITIELTQANEDKSHLEQLYKLSEDAIRYYREATQLSEDISRLEMELRRTGSTRTINDCQRELEDLTDKSKTTRREMKRLQDDRESSFRIFQQLENNIRDYKDKLTQLGYKLDARNQDTDIKISPINNKIDQLDIALQECQSKWNSKLEMANKIANETQQNIQHLNSLNLKITSYESDSKDNQLESMIAMKQQLDSQIQSLKQKLDAKIEEISIVDKELADRKGVERELKDHLKYRSLQRQVKMCDQQLGEYKAQSKDFMKTSYEQKLELLKTKQTQLISSRGSLEGEVRQIQNQLERYQHELDYDYKNIEERHNKQFIQVKANEMAISDLDKYTSALQKAIMRYHSLKMEDLNKIIKELWMSTYRGGDIDYIEIRSDNEGSAANRSYNYRVVMIKDGKEMNMRGRCSAGQKVLTSIIIRLALAETFCVHCGILTLDEPTTNLDRDNIESLADSLTKIIRSRRSQTNFQLIVITHDEEFVEYLSRSEVAEGYYRISKDEKQCSVIRQQSFSF
ncbi:hypothetical protein BJ944DRAFT_242399 [Cunninghamella echinulata]|nr:hypothetical protein BJ944DRAFT_242399 [Cunninghamella echinulata]